MKSRARTLRRKATDAERLLWRHLRNRQLNGYKFRRQHVIGPYIVDFVCLDAKVIVEIDGGQHSEQQRYDEWRTRYLQAQGFRVLRFWNHDALADPEIVLEVIQASLRPSPRPSPRKRGEGEEAGSPRK